MRDAGELGDEVPFGGRCPVYEINSVTQTFPLLVTYRTNGSNARDIQPVRVARGGESPYLTRIPSGQ